MLGEQISESTGKRIVRRVLSTEPPMVEVSFEDSGNMLGIPTTGFGTYKSTVRPDGSLHGDGEGITVTAEGDAVTWKGHAIGKLGVGGAVSYRGILFFRTPSEKIARLNSVGGVFEFEVDPSGVTHSKVWEWK